ncbi:hypothetical protein C0J52_22998 [Blattella germanica]|nr:hypothetical protein C0J52_22998 [Blattella germanica]
MNWENVSLKNINIIRYPELGMIESRHAGYLCDSVKILSHKPPVSLSINYLDFGERQVGSGQSMPSPISITNHTNDTILFKWDVGHTFNQNSPAWIPHCDVLPQNVVMPASVPQTHVDLQGYAENPHVQIATRNLVVFPATFPGCEQVISVPIRNVTRHCLRYSFRESYIPNNVKVVEKSGILVANEIKNSLWQFTPYEPGEHAVSLMCEVEVLEYKKLQPLGKPFDIPVMGYGYSEYVDLVVSILSLNSFTCEI